MQGNNFLKIALLSILVACPQQSFASTFIDAYERAKNAYLEAKQDDAGKDELDRILFHVENALTNLENAPAHRNEAIRIYGANFFEQEREFIQEENENLISMLQSYSTYFTS